MVKHTAGGTVWQHRNPGQYIFIGTGEHVRRDGTAVLATGTAREAACRHSGLEWSYGRWLREQRGVNPFRVDVYVNDQLGLICAPVCADGAANPDAAVAALTSAVTEAAERGVDLVTANTVCGCGRTRVTDLDGLDDVFADVDLIVVS